MWALKWWRLCPSDPSSTAKMFVSSEARSVRGPWLSADRISAGLSWKLPSVEEKRFAHVHDPACARGSWPNAKEGGRRRRDQRQATSAGTWRSSAAQGSAEGFVSATS